MKLNIDFENNTITLTSDWNLEELHSKLKEICGNEDGNWDKWTIKQEVKSIVTPKEIYYTTAPLGQPYKPNPYDRVTCSTSLLNGKEQITNTNILSPIDKL